MKFLSNFDTQLEAETVSKYNDLYGAENVYVIHRAKIFWVFNCLVPGVGLFCMLIIIGIIVGRDSGDESFDAVKSLLGFIIGAVLVFTGGMKILKKYFDYKMDFCIVTPQEVVNYNQTGLLKRNSRTIDADKIKTVTADASGLINSMFNFGDMRFLSEGDNAEGGDISLNYIHNVNETKNIVRNLIEPHLQHRHHNHEGK